MLRKVIYIGEYADNVIYFDTKNNQALAASKSKLLDTKKANQTNKFIPFLITILMFTSLLGGVSITSGHYTTLTSCSILCMWLVEVVTITLLVERGLYKNVGSAELTSKEYFRKAIYSNLFWNNFENKKITPGKKIWAWGIIFILLLCFLGEILLSILWLSGSVKVKGDLYGILGAPIGSEILLLSFFGFIPAILIIFIYQNNPVRFFNVVEKYQKRKIKWST